MLRRIISNKLINPVRVDDLDANHMNLTLFTSIFAVSEEHNSLASHLVNQRVILA